MLNNLTRLHDRSPTPSQVADYSIECSSPKYQFIAAYAALATLVYPVGVPLLLLFQLKRLKRQLCPDPENLSEAEQLVRGGGG